MTRAHALAMLAACTAAAGPASLRAQTQGEPRLYLTVFGGYRAGRELWTLNGQPFAVLVPSGDTTVVGAAGLYDTLDLQRHVVPGFVVGALGTYFPGPHLGFQGEIAFLGMDLESHCSIRQTQPAYPTDVNPALCASLDRQSVAGSAVSLAVGLVGRMTPGKGTFPYVRASAGVIARDRGTIQLLGVFPTSGILATVAVVDDPRPLKTTIQFALGAGVAVTAGRGYQVWLEGRDIVTLLDRVTGRADPNNPTGSLLPPHGSRLFHNFALAVGFDVVFEQRRGRRY